MIIYVGFGTPHEKENERYSEIRGLLLKLSIWCRFFYF